MNRLAASAARASLYQLVDQTAETHQPVQILGKRNNGVLVSAEDWSAIRETRYLLSIPGMRESLIEGTKTPASKMTKKLKWLRMGWQLHFSKQAEKDARNLASAGLKSKAEALLRILEADPFQNPPPYEKPVGDLSGSCSRRINIKHRLAYQVETEPRIVKVLRMRTRYE